MNPTIVQNYYVLAVDKNGLMPPMRRDECNAGLVAAALMDLMLAEVVTFKKDQISVTGDLPLDLEFLASLYTYLLKGRITVQKLMDDYAAYPHHLKALVEAVGESLVDAGAATQDKGGMFGSKAVFIPEKDHKDACVDHLKAVVSEIPSEQDLMLLMLLDKTKTLKQYFSQYEDDALKATLQTIRKDPQYKALSRIIDSMNDFFSFWLFGLAIGLF